MDAAAKARPDTGTRSKFRWYVGALIFLIYTVVAADRANIGIVLPYIQKDFELSNTEAGALISLFFVFYATFQLPAGFLVGRLGVRRVLPAFLLMTSAATAFIGAAGSILTLKMGRALLGMFEAPLPIAMLATINRWFAPHEKGTMTGVLLAAAKFGPVIVPPLGALIILLSGWRAVFFLFAIPGVLLAIVWLFTIANNPSESTFVKEDDQNPLQGSPADQTFAHQEPRKRKSFPILDRLIRFKEVEPARNGREVFASWDIWGCGIAYLFMTGLINVILAWLPTYLTYEKNFSLMNVGMLASIPFVGGVLGNLFGGWLSDNWLGERRKPTMILSSAASAVMMLALINAPDDRLSLGALLFVTGFLLNVGFSSYSVYAMGRATKEAYPLAASFVNTGGQVGGALAPFITGVLLDASGWTAVFIFLAACSAISIVILATVTEPKALDV